MVQSAGPDISARASSYVIAPQALFYNIGEVSGLAKHQRFHGAVHQHCWYCNKKESSPISSWGHQAFKSHLWQKYVISILHILYRSLQLCLRFQSQPQPEVSCMNCNWIKHDCVFFYQHYYYYICWRSLWGVDIFKLFIFLVTFSKIYKHITFRILFIVLFALRSHDCTLEPVKRSHYPRTYAGGWNKFP